MRATLKKLKEVIRELRNSSTGEGAALADVLDNAVEANDVGLGISICEEMEGWARKARLTLQGKLKNL